MPYVRKYFPPFNLKHQTKLFNLVCIFLQKYLKCQFSQNFGICEVNIAIKQSGKIGAIIICCSKVGICDQKTIENLCKDLGYLILFNPKNPTSKEIIEVFKKMEDSKEDLDVTSRRNITPFLRN